MSICFSFGRVGFGASGGLFLKLRMALALILSIPLLPGLVLLTIMPGCSTWAHRIPPRS